MSNVARKPVKRKRNPPATPRNIEAQAEKFHTESPIAADEAKRASCRMLAELFALHTLLVAEKMSGDYNAEEARTIPAIASNAKRLLNELRITAAQIDDEEEL